MSESIDRRVVEMRFDAQDFLKNVTTTMTVLDKLGEKLGFKNSAKDFNASASNISGALDGVKSRFSALEIVGMTALVNLTNSAINFGKQMAKSLTIDQVKAGFAEYELKMNSIQTIMASTGKDIDTVNGYLNELNTYADKTIYSFSDMTASIGKFTNAGVDLDTAVKAIQGISNEAAVSGANANEASRAMYNFAQALSAGDVKLIDWKSIENANMATKEFKQQLIDTAVACGTLEKQSDGMYKVLTKGTGGRGFDEAISSTKNFNDSLSAAWMTTDVLTTTLGRYADGTTEIGKKAFAAAQDVKTFSQLIDTVKESIGSGWAQTFEIIFGNLEEAKTLWTSVNEVISGFVNRTSTTRNTILQTWKDLGGRKDIADGLKTAFGALGKAFSTAFPKASLQRLDYLGKRLKQFTEGFAERMKIFVRWQPYFTDILTAVSDVVGVLKDAFAGLFDVLDGGGGESALGALLTTFISFIAFVSRGISALIEFGQKIGVFDIIHSLLLGINDLFFGLIDTVYAFADSVTDAFEKIPEPVAHVGEALDKVFAFIDEHKGKAIDVIATAFGKLFSLIGKGLSKIDLGKIGAFLAGSGILMAGKKLADMLGGLQIKFDDLLELPKSLSSVKKTFKGLSDTLNDFQTSIKVKTLATIAVSLGILAHACVQLAGVPADKLTASVAAIAVLFTELAGASYITSGKVTKGLISLSVAIVVLAKAVKTLSEVDNIGQGLIGVGVLLAELGAFCFTFDRLKIKPRALKRTAAGLILMAVAINLLAKPVQELGAMDTDSLIQGLEALGAMLVGFTATAYAFSKFKPKGLMEAGKAMVVMAAAMTLLVMPISALASMDRSALEQGLGGLATALIEIVGFSAVMSKIASSTGNIMKVSAALLLMSIGLKIMSGAVAQMSATKDAGQGLSVMFGALVILAGAMALMQNSLSGAAAMIIVAGALVIMAPAIALLSSLPMLGVAVGLAALAGTLLIFAGLSGLLSPLVPVMLALTGAIALLGVAVAGVGAGLMLMVAAFLMAAGPVTKGAEKLAQAFPIVAKGIGEGIAELIKTLGENAEAIKDSFLKIVESILTVLRSVVPDLVVLGLELLDALLSGIDQHIESITTTTVSIITKFINGISNGLPQIVDAGFNLMLSFLNSMADAISTNGDKLANALLNVVLAAIGAIVGLIPGVGKKGKEMIDSYRKGLDSGKAPAAKTAKNVAQSVEKNMKVKDQKSNGANAVRGLKNGMESLLPSLRSAANKVADIVDKTIRKKNQIKSPSRRLFATGSYMMQGLINGVDSLSGQYEKKADNIATMMIASANRSVDSVNSIFQNGFSNGFDLNNSIDRAVNVSLSMDKINDRNAELSKNISRLTSSLDGMTETMNSRSLNNYITVDGAADPELFADELINSFRLNARTV